MYACIGALLQIPFVASLVDRKPKRQASALHFATHLLAHPPSIADSSTIASMAILLQCITALFRLCHLRHTLPDVLPLHSLSYPAPLVCRVPAAYLMQILLCDCCTACVVLLPSACFPAALQHLPCGCAPANVLHYSAASENPWGPAKTYLTVAAVFGHRASTFNPSPCLSCPSGGCSSPRASAAI